MENYDPEFVKIVKNGDILVSGFNFGTGSSREQAATALKHRGIQLVIAGSFSQTYKRNAINNGYIVIESPELVNDLNEQFGADIENGKLTIKTGMLISINFKKSRLVVGEKVYEIYPVVGSQLITDVKEYNFDPVGVAAQELVIEEGLENWVKNRL